MIELRIDARSGLPAYLQIVQQVKHALRLGLLQRAQPPGQQQAINPNTVMKAYRELEMEGLIGGRPGQGTFVLETLPGASMDDLEEMRTSLNRWLKRADELGLDEESVVALFTTTLRTHMKKEHAA